MSLRLAARRSISLPLLCLRNSLQTAVISRHASLSSPPSFAVSFYEGVRIRKYGFMDLVEDKYFRFFFFFFNTTRFLKFGKLWKIRFWKDGMPNISMWNFEIWIFEETSSALPIQRKFVSKYGFRFSKLQESWYLR